MNLVTGGDQIAQMAAAKAWSVWEGLCSTLKPNPGVVGHFHTGQAEWWYVLEGNMATRIEAARLLTVQAAQKKASGERADLEAVFLGLTGRRLRDG